MRYLCFSVMWDMCVCMHIQILSDYQENPAAVNQYIRRKIDIWKRLDENSFWTCWIFSTDAICKHSLAIIAIAVAQIRGVVSLLKKFSRVPSACFANSEWHSLFANMQLWPSKQWMTFTVCKHAVVTLKTVNDIHCLQTCSCDPQNS